jgi:hypothetical protein
MKKITMILSVLMLFILASQIKMQAQVIFYEDFDGVGGPTSGGAGTYSFPSGWFLRNVDNGTPASSVSYVNEAWERREDFAYNVADSCAFSTSWYSPSGIANDWMWTPLIGPLPANCVLSWNAVAYDPAYPDGYEVRIMTSSQGPPTGGTGVIGNQLTSSTVIFSTTAESASWTSRTVNLNAYTGQSVYIGFRNNSNDKFLLLIDDIRVEVSVDYDARMMSTDTMEYTMIPIHQAQPVTFNGSIYNNGNLALTNVRMQVNVYDAYSTLLTSLTSSPVASVASGSTQYFSVASFTPSAEGTYYYTYKPLMNETDQNPANDSLMLSIIYTDTVYARDNGVVSGTLGIGAGDGFLGQEFTIHAATDLRSITSFLNVGYTGKKLGAAVWDMSGGFPNVMIATTDTLIYPDDSARLYNLNISGGPLHLLPGDYVFTMIEFDSTLAVALTDDIFTAGKTWVDWSTNPIVPWGHNEEYGSQFAKAYIIRPNMWTCDPISNNPTTNPASCSSCPDGTASLTPAGGTPPYTYLWNNGQTQSALNDLLPGDYTVTISDAYGCFMVDSITIGFTVGMEETAENGLSVFPNPNQGNFDVIWPFSTGANLTLTLVNSLGEVVFESTEINHTGSIRVSLENMSPGIYLLRMRAGETSASSRFLIY